MPVPRLRPRSPAWLRWPRRTARLRFTAVYGVLFLVSGAVLVAIAYGLFQHATEFKRPQLPQVPHTPAIQRLHTALPQKAPPQPLGYSQAALPQLAQVQNQLAQNQRQLFKSVLGPGTGPGLARALPQLARDQHQLARDQHQLAQAVNQLARAVHQVAQAGSVQAAQRAADSHQLLVNSGIALAIVAVLALLAGWLVAGRMLRPLRTITRTARRISSTSLHERLALDGPQDELKDLGDTLDDLFGRLDAAFEAQRHFVANASHELRTPLTAERNLLQVALDDPHTDAETWRSTAQELLACNDEQKHLIDALLTLASSESGLDHREPVDLSAITQTVLLDARRDTGRLGLNVETTIASAPVEGDPRLLERLVANLVDNAVAHNVEGGRVEVSTGTNDGKALLAVRNTGRVIPATEIDRLFQPFQRIDPRRIHHNNGHGLGLSIVRAVAIAHGATITAQPSPHGGVSIEVAFPRLPQHDMDATTSVDRPRARVTNRGRPAPHREPAPQATPPGR
jgi:signal transduction histidine kinase